MQIDLEEIRNHCIAKNGVSEEFPFDQSILAFKVGGKIFVLLDCDNFDSINLKCDPLRSEELRERYEEITPGYHMNKKHWNTVVLNGTISKKLLIELIDHSYDLVYSSLPTKVRNDFES